MQSGTFPFGKIWTDQEKQILKDNYKQLDIYKLMELLPDRTRLAIEKKVQDLNLTKKSKWTKDRVEILKNCKGMTARDVQKNIFPFFTYEAVWYKMSKLNLITFQYKYPYKLKKADDGKMIPEHRYIVEQHLNRKLTKEEKIHHINMDKRDNRIENLWLCNGNSAHMLAHCSVIKIIKQLIDTGIVLFNQEIGQYVLSSSFDFTGQIPDNIWTKEQEQIMHNLYKKISTKKLSGILGKSEGSISSKGKNLGLSLNPRWSIDEYQLLLSNLDKNVQDIYELFPNRSKDAIRRMQLKFKKDIKEGTLDKRLQMAAQVVVQNEKILAATNN